MWTALVPRCLCVTTNRSLGATNVDSIDATFSVRGINPSLGESLQIRTASIPRCLWVVRPHQMCDWKRCEPEWTMCYYQSESG